MVDMESKQDKLRSYGVSCCWKVFPAMSKPESSSKKLEGVGFNEADDKQVESESHKRKPGGWKSMPFIIGNETFERLASFGLLANFMVYLRREYHMDQVPATNLINVYFGFANFAPLLGAFVSDAYLGRFWVISMGSIASLLGMVLLTFTAGIPTLRPAPCPFNYQKGPPIGQQMGLCENPNRSQMGFLTLCLALFCIGTGGVRPCSIPFGVDQFDHKTEEGRKGINSYYNWYYTTFTVVVMLTLTLVVYIQDSVSWVWGFGIPTFLMLCSILLFFVGKRLYVFVKPEGSVFTSIFRVFVSAYRKRHLHLPTGSKEAVFYDPPEPPAALEPKLPPTEQFSFLNKAAIILEGEVNIDGRATPSSKSRLCSIQEIEEVKCLIRVLPIWASGIICFTAATQQGTLTVSQAMVMKRHIGPNFQIPPGSIIVVSMIAVGIWVPLYDRILVPALRKITKHEEGITLLQRLGIGLCFSIASMIIAGLVEQKRRNVANIHHQNMSIAWLAPQLVVQGLAEAFNFIAQIEFYNKQFPLKLSSVATSLFFCTAAGASHLSAALVSIVHKITGTNGRPSWLTNDINHGRIDYFYYLLAILGVFNLVYFIICARKYRYKGSAKLEGAGFGDLELNLNKS